MPANRPCRLASYGDRLKKNKAALNSAFSAAGVPDRYRALFLCMAMLETNHLTADERDATKDKMGSAANVSLFNLSVDLVQEVGYKGNVWDLNKPEKLVDVVRLLTLAADKFGVERLLNFVRGGRTGFADSVSYDCCGYRDTIASMVRALDSNPGAMTDDRRIEVFLKHV